MKRSNHPAARIGESGHSGFTLIEVMIVVAIAGALATLAYPSYLSQVHRSHRLDAMIALSQVQQAQERWRANHSSFTSDLSSLGLPAQASDRYRIAISDSAAHGYTAVATAVASQASDTACASLTVIQSAGNTRYGSTGSATPRRCWNR